MDKAVSESLETPMSYYFHHVIKKDEKSEIFAHGCCVGIFSLAIKLGLVEERDADRIMSMLYWGGRNG